MHKYFSVTAISFKNSVRYRYNVIGGFLMYLTFIFVLGYLWRAIYAAGGSAQGYTLVQMIWYICVTELVVFGCNTGIFAGMTSDVKTGAIAYQLNRPYNFSLYQFTNAMGTTMLNFILFGILMAAAGTLFAGRLPGFDYRNLPAMVLSIWLGITLSFFLRYTIGLSAFFIEDNNALMLISSKLVHIFGTFMPVEFLPAWLQPIVKLLPFSYISWAPAKLFVAFTWSDALNIIPVQIIWVIVFVLLSNAVYTAGVKRINTNGG